MTSDYVKAAKTCSGRRFSPSARAAGGGRERRAQTYPARFGGNRRARMSQRVTFQLLLAQKKLGIT